MANNAKMYASRSSKAALAFTAMLLFAQCSGTPGNGQSLPAEQEQQPDSADGTDVENPEITQPDGNAADTLSH